MELIRPILEDLPSDVCITVNQDFIEISKPIYQIADQEGSYRYERNTGEEGRHIDNNIRVLGVIVLSAFFSGMSITIIYVVYSIIKGERRNKRKT